MKAVIKSVGFGVLAMALFFCFFTLVAIPISMLIAHAHRTAAPDVFLPVPPWLFRRVGLPLSAAAFIAGLVMGWRRFRSTQQSAVSIQPSGAVGDRPSAVGKK